MQIDDWHFVNWCSSTIANIVNEVEHTLCLVANPDVGYTITDSYRDIGWGQVRKQYKCY